MNPSNILKGIKAYRFPHNTGLIMVYAGALLLIVGFIARWTNSNVFLFASMFLIIVGIILYVVSLKRESPY